MALLYSPIDLRPIPMIDRGYIDMTFYDTIHEASPRIQPDTDLSLRDDYERINKAEGNFSLRTKYAPAHLAHNLKEEALLQVIPG